MLVSQRVFLSAFEIYVFHEIWYERNAATGHPNALSFIFLRGLAKFEVRATRTARDPAS
jgi:hypothetical protein